MRVKRYWLNLTFCNAIYQLPFILTAVLQIDLIKVVYFTALVNMTLHFLNEVDDVELIRKSIIRS